MSKEVWLDVKPPESEAEPQEPDSGPFVRVTMTQFKRGNVAADELELSGDPDSVVRLVRLLMEG